MDPFFGNWYEQPDPHRYSFQYGPRAAAAAAAARRAQRQSEPRVFQIPVTDASDSFRPKVDRSGSALRIQKVLRGFLVRKSLKRITDVKKQVDAIEEKLSRRDEVELLRRDERERLRMNESLMSLLLKLDSIRGFDLGVRDCRKAVIKKAIALQEKIDSILAADDDNVEIVEEKEAEVSETNNCLNQMSDQTENEKMEDSCGEEDGETESVVDVGVVSEVKVSEANNGEKKADLGMENDDIDSWIEVDGVEKERKGDCRGDDGKRDSNELMERMMRDNEKMMNMMTQLFESNEKQMKMLTALAHRVELLEKAFVCDKLRRKTKLKRKAGGEE